MYHSQIFRDADQMEQNYMFLTGAQADTIAAAKTEIQSLSDRLDQLDIMAGSDSCRIAPERLERWYFSTCCKYIDACDNFAKWLYSWGYWETVAAHRDAQKLAILINK
jgi:hypothetical protein